MYRRGQHGHACRLRDLEKAGRRNWQRRRCASRRQGRLPWPRRYRRQGDAANRAAACARRDRWCASRRSDSAGAGRPPGRQKRISESSASAIWPPPPTADATAIARARSASPADRPSPAPRGRCDSRAPSIRAESSAAPPPCAAGCRAAAGCLCPWPPAAGSRAHRRARRKRGASRRRENRRSRPEVPRSGEFLDPVVDAQAGNADERRGRGAVASAAVTDAMPCSISCLERSSGS